MTEDLRTKAMHLTKLEASDALVIAWSRIEALENQIENVLMPQIKQGMDDLDYRREIQLFYTKLYIAEKEKNKKLEQIEAWARFSYELPWPCWSGYHVRAMRGIDKALDAIKPKKEMLEDEIDARSRELKEKYKV